MQMKLIQALICDVWLADSRDNEVSWVDNKSFDVTERDRKTRGKYRVAISRTNG
jgi:hypothetical protein